jgi:uncharacterized protein (TIGR03083 family)
VDVDALLDGLSREGALLLEAIERGDPDAKVPSCPDWTLRDLVHHTGGIHRWATRTVNERASGMIDEELEVLAGGWPDDQDLGPWFRAGHALLLDALRATPDDAEIWAFLRGSPSGRAFWARRQLHETTIHRVDAELASGAVSPVPIDHAIDGIDELLTGFLPRRSSRLKPAATRTIAVNPTDSDAGWLVTAGPEGASTERARTDDADLVLRGSAASLYLLLWNRDADGVAATGDRELLDEWRTSVTVTWS